MNLTFKLTVSIAVLFVSNSLFSQNTIPANGNVGIGTTNPSALLDVNGNMVVDSSVVIKDSLNVQKKLIVDQDLKIKGESVFVGDGKFKDKLVVDGLTKLNGDLKIKSLENTSITNNRIVFIQPNGKLNSSIEIFPQPPTSNCLTVLPWSIASSLAPNAPINAVVLCPSYGNLGVGTVVPNSKLNIYTATETGLIVETEHQNDYGYGVQSKVARNMTKAFAVYNTNENKETFTVMGNGDVNILNKGKLIFDGTQPNWNSWNTAICTPMGGAWVTSTLSNTGHYTGFGMTVTGLYYGRSINPVSSNNTNIQYLFQVDLNGMVRCREILVDNFGWSDYVFKDDYRLKPLVEVEEYINKNKHLPNIPSEKELSEKGLNIGNMQQLQMEKIEELTLYIIQLEKRIKQLETIK